MKIAVTGNGKGKLRDELIKRGCIPIMGDIADYDEITYAINIAKPDVLIHCAAMTDVKKCEEDRMEAFRINCRGTANVIDAFPRGTLIYISTVHVFNGRAWHPYSESHVPSPVNVYGLTKYSAELVCKFRLGKSIIIRASKLFDKDFIVPNLTKLQAGESLEFTDILIRSFTYLPHFADTVLKLVDKADTVPELIHLCSNDVYSYYQFWLAVCQVFGLDYSNIKPRNYELKDETPRPLRGGMHNGLALRYGLIIPSALEGLKEIKENI